MNKRDPEAILREIENSNKGKLKIYVGAAPGVGKTFHMLRDARELKAKGIDIVIGLVEAHGRAATEQEIKDLEIIPKKILIYKNHELPELDLEAVLSRKPEIVLVDELAHTNVKGSKNKKRFQDILEILDHGIDVWTAVNIQHFESVQDIVSDITGIKVNERVPHFILSDANEVEVVDASPETIRQRIKEGKIYSVDKIEQTLSNFFKQGNLVALRELMLREVADDIDVRLEKERIASGVDHPAGIHEKILVCINYRPNAAKLIRRGGRIATRLNASFHVLHIRPPKEIVSGEDLMLLEEWQVLVEQFGGDFLLREVKPTQVAEEIVKVCKQHQITQLIMGMSARTRWEEIWKGSIINRIMQKWQLCDVLIVADR